MPSPTEAHRVLAAEVAEMSGARGPCRNDCYVYRGPEPYHLGIAGHSVAPGERVFYSQIYGVRRFGACHDCDDGVDKKRHLTAADLLPADLDDPPTKALWRLWLKRGWQLLLGNRSALAVTGGPQDLVGHMGAAPDVHLAMLKALHATNGDADA